MTGKKKPVIVVRKGANNTSTLTGKSLMSTVTRKGDHLQYPCVEIEAQGSLLAVARRYNRVTRPSVGGKRGLVTGFSSGSRRRLIRKLARLDIKTAKFLTLTYPLDYPHPQQAKNHHRALLERIRRRWPQASAIWRLEFQQRGAPHFHYLFFNLPWLPFKVLRRWWAEIIDHDQSEPLFVRIEAVKSKRGVMYYASKYMSKTDGDADGGSALFNYVTYLHAGRVWGIFNKAFIPFAELVKAAIKQVTPVAFDEIKVFLAKFWSGIDIRAPGGATVFTEQAYFAYLDALSIALRDCPYVLAQ